MSIETTTTWVCDGCGHRTVNPDGHDMPHATMHLEVSRVETRTLLGIGMGLDDGAIKRRVRTTNTHDAWLCADCTTKALTIIRTTYKEPS